MICKNYEEVEPVEVGKGVTVRWLTHKDLGGEEYLHNHALRMFTIAPKSEVGIHNHEFTQIVYILSGTLIFSVLSHDGTRKDRKVGPGDYVYTYSYEHHGIRNPSDSTPVNLLCCIDCVGDKANCVPTR